MAEECILPEDKDPDLTYFFASTKNSRGRELRVYLPISQQLVKCKIVFHH